MGLSLYGQTKGHFHQVSKNYYLFSLPPRLFNAVAGVCAAAKPRPARVVYPRAKSGWLVRWLFHFSAKYGWLTIWVTVNLHSNQSQWK